MAYSRGGGGMCVIFEMAGALVNMVGLNTALIFGVYLYIRSFAVFPACMESIPCMPK